MMDRTWHQGMAFVLHQGLEGEKRLGSWSQHVTNREDSPQNWLVPDACFSGSRPKHKPRLNRRQWHPVSDPKA